MALMCHCEILKANLDQVGPKELINVTLKQFKLVIMSGKVKICHFWGFWHCPLISNF